MFVGRTGLLELVDRLTAVPGRSGDTRPVLVVEGCGGSGRTALLGKALERWQNRTPTALVSPGKLLSDQNSALRPVLAAVMLGLSVRVPGYGLAFERVLLAEIAIATRTEGLSPDEALDELRTQTNKYRNRGALIDLVGDIVDAVGAIVANLLPAGLGAVVPTVTNRVAQLVVEPLRTARRGSQLVWSKEALEWFGHQSQGLTLNPEHARLQLSAQARSENPAVRRGVDDLLVAALLADLRHSLARAAGRPANVLVLLDDGDVPSASSFTSALLRIRQALADTPGSGDLPDPLTLVTASGGALAGELAGRLPPAALVDEEAVAGAPLTGLWLRVSSRDLRRDQVVRLAKNHLWGELAYETVGEAVHRLTRGHPESTGYVLRRLHDEPDLVDDLDRLLRRDGPDPGVPVHRHLLRPFVRGLGEDEDILLDAVVTVSAAVDRLEAQGLVDLLPASTGLDSAVFTSPTLWTGPGPGERLHPLARYLGMRALADEPQRWQGVLTRLLDRAGDERARLRHARLLGDREAVAARLVALLPELPTGEWLELFDAVTAEPDPRERDADVVRAVSRPNTLEGHAFRLLGVVPAVDHDPCWTEKTVVRTFCVHAAQGFRQLSEQARDAAPLLLRALAYEGRGRARG